MTRTALAPEREGDLIGLELAELQAGQAFESPCERETRSTSSGSWPAKGAR